MAMAISLSPYTMGKNIPFFLFWFVGQIISGGMERYRSATAGYGSIGGGFWGGCGMDGNWCYERGGLGVGLGVVEGRNELGDSKPEGEVRVGGYKGFLGAIAIKSEGFSSSKIIL